MKAHHPPQQPPHMPPYPMAGPPHPQMGPPIMPFPHPAMYGPPPHYPMPGMYQPSAMPPLVPSTKPIGEAKKADDAAPAGSTSDTTKGTSTPKAAASNDGDGDDDKTKKAGGLDLLASLAFPGQKDKAKDGKEQAKEEKEGDGGMPPLSAPFDPKNPNAAAIAILQKESKNKKKKTRMEEMSPKEKLFVDKVRESDVLCGRGGKFTGRVEKP